MFDRKLDCRSWIPRSRRIQIGPYASFSDVSLTFNKMSYQQKSGMTKELKAKRRNKFHVDETIGTVSYMKHL